MKTPERIIATLEVETAMIESHARKLTTAASALTDREKQRQLLRLAEEETAKAETIRHQIRLLKDHLGQDTTTRLTD